MERQTPDTLKDLDMDIDSPFYDGYNYFNLFYPAPEPTHEELFKEWVKDNNIKEGTRVKVVKHFSADGNSGLIYGTDDENKKYIYGSVGTIDRLCRYCADVKFSDGKVWDCPHTALEVVKETYRPFVNAEEFAPYRDEWFKHKESKCYDMCSSVTDYSDRGIVLCDPYSERDSLKFGFYTWGGFFEEFERENGDPCGIREEV